MGAVWKGRDITLDRIVALKRIGVTPGGQTPDLRRAEREARLAAMVNHPHVVAVFDMIEDDHQQWLVMEYVEGRSLAQLIRDNGPLDPAFVASALAQVADALGAAHAAGVVHRDVKPSNILVTDAGVAKLTDFGIARSSDDDNQITKTGLVSGSPAYLAPEVASGRPATSAADVWALGATLFHALAGRPPYEVGENVMGVLYQIVHEAPPRLPAAGWLGDLLEHTLVQEPEKRWPMAVAGTYLRHGPDGVRKLGISLSAPTTLSSVDEATHPSGPPRGGQRGARSAPVALDQENRGATRSRRATGAEAAPDSRRPGPRPRRRMGLLNVALVVMTVLLVTGLASAAWLIGRDASPSQGTGPSTPPTSAGKTTDAPSTPATVGPTETGMRTFIANYLATVVADPAQAWGDLTPAFQSKSNGGFDGYRTFWIEYSGAELLSLKADPEAMTVDYQVRYTTTSGRTWTDRVSLQLEYRNGVYQIAGEPG